jgi:hypothetical protein
MRNSARSAERNSGRCICPAETLKRMTRLGAVARPEAPSRRGNPRMQTEKVLAAEVDRKINVTDIEIAGAWMPCEYVQDRVGRVRVVMLADVDFDEPARGAVWHLTLEAAAAFRFDRIEPCRKLTLRVSQAGRPIDECSFQQRLKRDLIARDHSA